MGKDAVDRAVIELRRLTRESVTEKLPLVGADGFFALEQQRERISQESGLDAETVTHLLNRYGSLISEILEIIAQEPKLAKKLDPELAYIKAEIVYAASHEGARTVDDVISRRTRLAFEAQDHGVHLADEVAALIAPVLGWSAKNRKESVTAYEELVDRELAALDELLEANS
jgi:glycerol-3-phosphate dehydrogenase